MENKMQVFSSQQFGNVRVVERDGEPWFVAADVCKALEIANNRDALTGKWRKALCFSYGT